MPTYPNLVYARGQYFLADDGHQFTSGYDAASVIARGRSPRTLAKRAGGWIRVSGYRVYEERSEQCLGNLYQVDPGRWIIVEDD